jgi:integrase
MSRGAGRLPGGIYAREQGGLVRYYARIGGQRMALIPPGEKRATTDPKIAQALYAQLVTEYQKQQLRGIHDIAEPCGLAEYAREHLIKKRQAGEVTTQSMKANQRHLERAVACFGADADIGRLTVADVSRWIAWLKDRGLGGDTIKHHLDSLSNLYVRAIAEGRVSLGYNPVASMPRKMKPKAAHREARWLEVNEASLLLEASRFYRGAHHWDSAPFGYELVATYLLTGGRPSEVTGLEVDDISLERETVTFRQNRFRRLKTATSARVVRLWPQLAEILKAYFPKREQMGQGTLLFPSFRTGKEGVFRYPHRIVARVAERAGLSDVTPYTLRHTYCSARLQTLDGAAPVSPFTIGRELGHGGDQLVRKIYGHLGTVRHRSNVVEYRVEQHAATLGDRIAAVAALPAQEPTARDLKGRFQRTDSDTVTERRS